MNDIADDPVYDVVATFAARLAGRGVTEVVISPGSRSTPLTLCLDAQPGLTTWVHLDERSAGFFALGLGRATGRPAVLVCTSGTAAANYLPAVVEASHAGVPLIVCTADRPPELRGWGSPQTIDQVGLYGTAVLWSVDLPVPDEAAPGAGAGWADKAVDRATGADPGPVHLNWPLREPLEPASGKPVPVITPEHPASAVEDGFSVQPASAVEDGFSVQPASAVEDGFSVQPASAVEDGFSVQPASAVEDGFLEVPASAVEDGFLEVPASAVEDGFLEVPASAVEDGFLEGPAELSALAGLAVVHERGVVVVGPWPGGGLHQERLWADAATSFAHWAGWPLIGEPITHVRSTCVDRRTDDAACIVTTADHLLADQVLRDEMRPDVAVVVGRTVTTKPVRLWLERTRPAHVVLIDPEDRWEQAVFRLTGHVPASVEALGELAAEADPVETMAPSRFDPTGGAEGSAEPCPSSVDRARPDGWLATWRRLEAAASNAIGAAVDNGPLLSARAARTLVRSLPADAVLMTSSSMPVRDLDAFVTDTGSVVCCANRGAAGIDGTTSTALGIAASDRSKTVALYTGDLALLHDLGGLVAAARLGLHLIAVCVDNDGGEIFSMLPVAERMPAEDFERLFRTPHGLDWSGLDGFGGIRARRVTTASALAEAVGAAAEARTPGVDLLVVDVGREDDIAQRRALTSAAQQAAHQVLALRA